MTIFRQCTRAEFEAFCASYGKPLVGDLSGISDPPTYTVNDFSDGKKWPESTVAIARGKSFAGYDTDEDEYRILESAR